MPLRQADAFVLRTYPLKESDKIVSLFTREYGKCRGVARAARRPKSKFGSLLEPLTEIRVQFFERENRDLSNLDHCELIASLWQGVAAPEANLIQSVSASLIVEVADRMLPDREVNDAVYRLLAVVTAALRTADAAWLPLTYYLYWMIRLGGFLPNWSGNAASDPSAEALQLAARVRRPFAELGSDDAAAAAGPAGCDLRQHLKCSLEDHIESGLRSWPMLASLEPSVPMNS